MGKYILQRIEDGKYVTPACSEKSYTDRLQKARTFNTREEAEREKCGNERIVPLEDAVF